MNPQIPNTPNNPIRPRSLSAVAGFTCGLCSLFPLLGFYFVWPAILFGGFACFQCISARRKGLGLAITGMILAVLAGILTNELRIALNIDNFTLPGVSLFPQF
jgi:hypothetical protein